MPENDSETKPYTRGQVQAFKELQISSATDKDVVIRMLRKIYDPSNPSNPHQLNLRPKKIREDIKAKLRKALHDRKFLNELPEHIPKGNLNGLVGKLYSLTKSSHRLRDWGGWGLSKRSESVSPACPVSSVASTPPLHPKDQKSFDFTKATVLPNVDIQIIRANRPNKSVAYRLCDFIKDEWQPSARSADGGWVDGSRLQIERLKAALMDTKHIKSEDETLWWSPWPLHIIDVSKITMQAAEDEEILLTNANFFSSLQRYVEINFPHLGPGNPSIQEEGYIEVRPIITLIVRSEDATGKQTLYQSQSNSAMTTFEAYAPGVSDRSV
ncbi:hypothetical protein N7481_006073 [Penicillium waksmanii]|uniref:uncharacterized protein n=1 Tax=Penicillium waksmanii TaxID=69791 RepID=UPI002548F749|nr:uncharacterized protein N7481_006073 [Penicillium waksmanii]KAJ5983974.1 hypothetical protein N7481_006073 [Penicillium waksmanii]